MRFVPLVFLLALAPSLHAQDGQDTNAAFADSLGAALSRFSVDFVSASLSMPDSVDVLALAGWDEVRETGISVMSAAERAAGWHQVLPLMECGSDRRVILTQLGLTAGQLGFRADRLAEALAAVELNAADPEVAAGVRRVRDTVIALEADLQRAFSASQ